MDRAREIASQVTDGSRSAHEVIREALDRIEADNARSGAFVSVSAEGALDAADQLDARRQSGEALGALAGVPVAVKDNICTDAEPTSAGSSMLDGYRSPFVATAVRRLVEAGAIVVGKTNMDEFGMGSSCEHSVHGPTRNPWDPTRVPGGSSGGSAAAVGAGVVPLALGSDTGGSIRQPSAMCGVTGCKPTYGRVSRYGLVAYASSLDQIGPIGVDAADCALALGVMGGLDAFDATSADRPLGECDGTLDDLDASGLVLGVPTIARGAHNDPEAQAVFDRALEALRGAGAEVREIELVHAEHAVAAYYVIAMAEASSNLARYDGVRYGFRASDAGSLEAMYTRSRTEGFGEEVRRRILLGTHVLSSGYYDAYYTTALKARRRVAQDYGSAFDAGCDALVLPTTPGPAFKIGAKVDDPLAMYAEDLYTVGASLAGLPAVSTPMGWIEREGASLPLGMQLVGPAWGERRVLGLASLVERVLDAAHRG